MKYCPNCRTQYTDDTLKFCLQDGTPLAEIPDSPMKTMDYGETETLVSNRPPSSTSYRVPTDQQWQAPPTVSGVAPVKKSRTGLTVVMAMILMLLIFLGAGLGAWVYLKNKQTETAKNANAPVNANAANVNKTAANAASNVGNANAKTPTPTPKSNVNAAFNDGAKSLSPAETAVVRREVGETIDGWNAAAESHNFDAYMEKYADSVDYYTKKAASVETVRDDKQRAFSKYDSINFKISNLVITPDASGHHATAVFDKEWTFEGDEETSTGKVKTELRLENKNNEWLITSEKDLKLYHRE